MITIPVPLLFIAAHRVLELPAIFIGGAAVWRSRAACSFPACCRVANPWPEATAEPRSWFSVAVPLLLVAGAINGLLSPTGVPVAMKLTVAAVMFLALVVYLLSGRRKKMTLR